MEDIISNITKILPFILIGLGVLVLLIIFLVWYFKKAKRIKVDNIYMVTGSIGTGKTVMSLSLAIYKYFKNTLQWFISRCVLTELYILTFRKIEPLRKKLHLMRPMFYTNMAVKYIRYNRFTADILYRRVRIPNKSVVFIDESSLLADSFNFKNKTINSDLLSFFKTFRHFSHGGCVILNTQSISDNHFSVKRVLSKVTYIYKRIKLPFVTLFRVTERVYSDDGSLVNVNKGDLENNGLLTFIMPNFIYKIYDTYYLSIFTDSLAYQVDYKNPIRKLRDSLKCEELVTVNDFSTLDRRDFKYEKKN